MFKTLKYLEINLIRKNIRPKKNNLLRIVKQELNKMENHVGFLETKI